MLPVSRKTFWMDRPQARLWLSNRCSLTEKERSLLHFLVMDTMTFSLFLDDELCIQFESEDLADFAQIFLGGERIAGYIPISVFD